eukprot:tig00000254_g22545.t1
MRERAACLRLASAAPGEGLGNFVLRSFVPDVLADFRATLHRLMVDEPFSGRIKVVVRFGHQLFFHPDAEMSLEGLELSPSKWCKNPLSRPTKGESGSGVRESGYGSGVPTGPAELFVPPEGAGGRILIDTARFKRHRRFVFAPREADRDGAQLQAPVHGGRKVSITEARPAWSSSSPDGYAYGEPSGSTEIALTRMDWRETFKGRGWEAGDGQRCYDCVTGDGRIEELLEEARALSRAAGPHGLDRP